MLGGRGAGKTRAGAEWVRQQIIAGRGIVGMIAPTASDARKVLVEGESGLLAVSFKGDTDRRGNTIGRPTYKPGSTRLVWENGAICHLYSAEEPDRLRGPQHEALLADEVATWKSIDTWDMAMFGLRLGQNPQVMATTTPKPIPLIRELIREAKTDPTTVVTKASTYANRAHLAPAFFAKVIKKYEGTRLGRQELDAEILDEAEGALWTRAEVEKAKLDNEGLPIEVPDDWFKRIVVSVDPPASSGESAALCGIVVSGIGYDDNGYVIDDRSKRASPGEWAKRAVQAARDHNADRIIAEANNGGEMVEHTIRTVWPNAPVKVVHASKGKQARAEPVKSLYEQDRVKHLRAFEELEDQMVTWEPNSGMPSPDRLDALVWGLHELMIEPDTTGNYAANLRRAARS